jgi:hypothetical protein
LENISFGIGIRRRKKEIENELICKTRDQVVDQTITEGFFNRWISGLTTSIVDYLTFKDTQEFLFLNDIIKSEAASLIKNIQITAQKSNNSYKKSIPLQSQI